MDALDRLFDKVSPEPNSGCWLWTGALNNPGKRGYGQIWVEGKLRLAHRVAYESQRGPIPAGLDLDHLCRVRCCVNPDHLEPVTRSVNNSRSPLLGLAAASRTHCPKGHAYDESNTRWDTKGARNCRSCERVRHRRDGKLRRARARLLSQETTP